MTIVDIYGRVSTDPQEDNTSLDEQETAGRAYCQEAGLTVGLVHREVFSGYVYREREKLNLMRERYRQGIIQGVVIRTLDRLSRNQTHIAVLMEEMEHYDTTIHCVMEKIDNTAMGKFVVAALALIAEMEREKIMDRTTTGRVNKAKAGIVVTGSKALYGRAWCFDEQGNKKIIIQEDEAKVLRWLGEQYADGVSAHDLMKQLNERGEPGPEGGEWNDRSIVRLISDPRVTGKHAQVFAYQRRKAKRALEPIDLPDGTYPEIIDEALFARILERRERNQADAVRASRHPEEYLLRAGFTRCGRCNRPMMAVKHRKTHIYRCTHTDLDHTNVIRSKELDMLIWAWLQQLADHITLIETAVELATSSDQMKHDTAAIEKSIVTWKAKAANYLSDLDDSNLIGDTRAAVRNALNNANKMIAQLEEERAQIAAGMIDWEREQAAYQDILTWCKKVKGSREELTYQQKRDFLHMLGIVVVIENEKPYYEHMVYHIEVTLPAIQELITPHMRVNSKTSSPEDIAVTEQLVQAGKLLEIELVDHLIIGNHRYTSLKEQLHW